MATGGKLSGLFGIIKPKGISSAQALEVIKGLLNAPKLKLGHGGTLDPEVTGVLGSFLFALHFICFII